MKRRRHGALAWSLPLILAGFPGVSPVVPRSAAFAAVTTAGSTATSVPDPVTTIILVRHAERDTLMLGADPPLRREGRARAQLLARMLANTPLKAVYGTSFQRNRQTAGPVLEATGDSLRILEGVDFAAQAARIRREAAGGTALVVGHSDTVPQLIEALTGEKIEGFHGDFDRFYVVTLYPGGAKALRLSYGEPPPK